MTNKNSNSSILDRAVAEVLPSKEDLIKLMEQRPIRLYLGIDPTGAFLHLGHAVVLRKLQQFAELGHEVILLVGNATVKIGDPTGRDESRPMLSNEEIEENFQDWQRQASVILDFDKIKVRYNDEWWGKMGFDEVVKIAANTTVQQLLERDMFQERMKKELPVFTHELLYPLIQGYDSVAMDVDLELGGTDQTFNMLMGRSLQKTYHNKEKWVLATPLIEGTDGRKMSKSFNNYIALTDEPSDVYGKLMSLKDELILKYFRLLTDVPLTEIEEMEQAMQQGENPIEFKKKLAFTITQDLHSTQIAQAAQKQFEQTVQAGELPSTMTQVELKAGKMQVLEILKACQPDESNSRLRRLAEQGGVRLMPQDKKLTDPYQEIEVADEQAIRVGKRDYYQLKIS